MSVSLCTATYVQRNHSAGMFTRAVLIARGCLSKKNIAPGMYCMSAVTEACSLSARCPDFQLFISYYISVVANQVTKTIPGFNLYLPPTTFCRCQSGDQDNSWFRGATAPCTVNKSNPSLFLFLDDASISMCCRAPEVIDRGILTSLQSLYPCASATSACLLPSTD
jgi:hypothetical protein